MFGKPEEHDSGNAPADTAAPLGFWRGKRRRKALLLIGLACLLAAAYQTYEHWRAPALPVPVPVDWNQISEPQVRDYLKKMVAYVEEAPREASRHATLGLAYAANGLWNLAEPAFRNAARLAPNDPLPWLYTAIALEQSGEKAKALAGYLLVTRKFPDFAPGFQRLGEAALQAGDLQEAARAFQRVNTLATNDWHGLAGLGEVLLRQKRFSEAVSLLKAAAQKAPSVGAVHYLLGIAYQQLGRTNEANRELRLGLNPTRYPMPDRWSSEFPRHMRRQRDLAALAQSLINAGQPQRAIALLRDALRLNTNSVKLMTSLAIAHNQAGEPDQARPLLERALRQDSNNIPALVALSAACLAGGDVTNARVWADRAIAAAPGAPQPYLARANVALAFTNNALALTNLAKAFAVAPANGAIQMDMGNILLLNEGKLDEALAHYQKAVEINPRLVPAYVRMAQIHLRRGDTNRALAVLRAARQYVPGDTNLARFEQAILAPPPPSKTNAPSARPTPTGKPGK
jgi:tetratricopeptide (TPR) repeat protein